MKTLHVMREIERQKQLRDEEGADNVLLLSYLRGLLYELRDQEMEIAWRQHERLKGGRGDEQPQHASHD